MTNNWGAVQSMMSIAAAAEAEKKRKGWRDDSGKIFCVAAGVILNCIL